MNAMKNLFDNNPKQIKNLSLAYFPVTNERLYVADLSTAPELKGLVQKDRFVTAPLCAVSVLEHGMRWGRKPNNSHVEIIQTAKCEYLIFKNSFPDGETMFGDVNTFLYNLAASEDIAFDLFSQRYTVVCGLLDLSYKTLIVDTLEDAYEAIVKFHESVWLGGFPKHDEEDFVIHHVGHLPKEHRMYVQGDLLFEFSAANEERQFNLLSFSKDFDDVNLKAAVVAYGVTDLREQLQDEGCEVINEYNNSKGQPPYSVALVVTSGGVTKGRIEHGTFEMCIWLVAQHFGKVSLYGRGMSHA